VIHAEGLCKHYGRHAAVRGLSFEVRTGETFALVGPNGAGKTTTLKCLLGLARPSAGSIRLGPRGLPPWEPETRASIGYVPQRVDFPRSHTAGEVLRFFADLRGLGRAEVDDAVERTGIRALLPRRAGELSGGMTQRLGLAQALLGRPEILVLDEPTASLDPEATHEFRALIEELQLEGKTIVLCSHLLAEVERVAHRALVLVEGLAAATLDLGRWPAPDARGNGGAPASLEERFLEAVRLGRQEAGA
jgi:ABC-type multidrug transport system ATPase subunit